MTHISTTQLMQFIDGTLLSDEREPVEAHLAQCPACRNELSLQQAILKAARAQKFVRPSKGFSAGVMRRILPRYERSFADRFLQNVGPLGAMACVIAIMWYAVSLGPSPETSETGRIVKQAREWFSSATELFTIKTPQVPIVFHGTRSSDQMKIIVLVVVSFLVLGLIDRFLLQSRFGARIRKL
ncbi:MAG TPA: zf-HC2 domain-containing protein [Bacteroidota bacterium]|nr:zf-HC2 domain-containing protein [Bacteroidota bacterium]